MNAAIGHVLRELQQLDGVKSLTSPPTRLCVYSRTYGLLVSGSYRKRTTHPSMLVCRRAKLSKAKYGSEEDFPDYLVSVYHPLPLNSSRSP